MMLVDEVKLLSLEKAAQEAFSRCGIGQPCSVKFVDGTDDACIERRAHHSEGDAPRTITIRRAWEGEAPSRTALSLLEHGAAHLKRLLDRDAAIAASGGYERDPPEWAFLVQTMAATIMANDGRDPLDLVRLDTAMRTRTGIRTRIGRTTTPGEEFDGLACGMTASLNRSCAEWHYQDAAGAGPVLGLKFGLPHTVAQGVVGVPLDDVIEDRRLAGSGLRIARTHVQPTGSVILILEKEWRSLAEPPPGIDTSWLQPPEAGVAVPTI